MNHALRIYRTHVASIDWASNVNRPRPENIHIRTVFARPILGARLQGTLLGLRAWPHPVRGPCFSCPPEIRSHSRQSMHERFRQEGTSGRVDLRIRCNDQCGLLINSPQMKFYFVTSRVCTSELRTFKVLV